MLASHQCDSGHDLDATPAAICSDRNHASLLSYLKGSENCFSDKNKAGTGLVSLFHQQSNIHRTFRSAQRCHSSLKCMVFLSLIFRRFIILFMAVRSFAAGGMGTLFNFFLPQQRGFEGGRSQGSSWRPFGMPPSPPTSRVAPRRAFSTRAISTPL